MEICEFGRKQSYHRDYNSNNESKCPFLKKNSFRREGGLEDLFRLLLVDVADGSREPGQFRSTGVFQRNAKCVAEAGRHECPASGVPWLLLGPNPPFCVRKSAQSGGQRIRRKGTNALQAEDGHVGGRLLTPLAFLRQHYGVFAGAQNDLNWGGGEFA